MSTLRTNNIANVAGTQSTDVLNVINGSAKAWVNFNGTGTVAIRASYNVSSITDNGTGDYTINLANAMPDTNYSISGTANTIDFNVGLISSVVNGLTFNATTTSFRILSWNVDRVVFDTATTCVQIFR